MIDLHCHMLPGMDDGPESAEEALNLAHFAVANGITHAVMTPHMHPGRYENDLEDIERACRAFEQLLSASKIPLGISAAAEVRISEQIPGLQQQGRLPFIGQWQGKPVVLIEFPHSNIPLGSDKLIAYLLKQGVQPMIAHPERNKDVLRKFEKIVPFVEQGCLLQVTAGSVCGDFGRQVQDLALHLLRRGWVTVLASDAHNIQHRPPDMASGRLVVARLLGSESAWALVRDNPMHICGLD